MSASSRGAGSPWAARGRRGWLLAAAAGGLLQLVVGFYTATAIGLISVPLWAAVVLLGAWAAAAVTFVALVRRAPVQALLLPLINGLLLWGLVAAGGAWWGWTA
jgi:hypothetical protein